MNLWHGLFEESKRAFQVALSFDQRSQGESWPEDETAIDSLSEYALACYKLGHLDIASGAIKSATTAAQAVFGADNFKAILLVYRCKAIRKKEEVM